MRGDYEFYSAQYKCNRNQKLKVTPIGGLNDQMMGGTHYLFPCKFILLCIQYDTFCISCC